MMKHLIIYLMLPLYAFAGVSVFDTNAKKEVSYKTMIDKLPSNGFIFLGEFHNQELIQKMQGDIIEATVLSKQLFNNFQVGWEFLDYTNQNFISSEQKKLIRNLITVEEFLTNTAGRNNTSYSPIIQAIKNKSGDVIALNIPRAIKQKLIKEGQDSVRSYLPPNFEVGGQLYRDRFYKAMGEHVPPNMKEPYFEAQCLTDSVMSYQAHVAHVKPLTFIVAGSFHTDFYQGTVSRLKKLTSEEVVTLKIVDSSQHTQEELDSFKNGDSVNGNFADFIVMVTP